MKLIWLSTGVSNGRAVQTNFNFLFLALEQVIHKVRFRRRSRATIILERVSA